MGPEAGETAGEGSPQESAGVPANTRERARKKANSELLTFVYWWRWGDSNPRPKALHSRPYMLSSSLGLAPGQHDAQSASGNQPA